MKLKVKNVITCEINEQAMGEYKNLKNLCCKMTLQHTGPFWNAGIKPETSHQNQVADPDWFDTSILVSKTFLNIFAKSSAIFSNSYKTWYVIFPVTTI